MQRTTSQRTGRTGRRRLRLLGLAVAGLTVAGACAGGGTKSFPLEAGSTTTSSTTTSTPLSPSTSTSVPPATTPTTRVGRDTTVTTRPSTPPPPGGQPSVVASPFGAAPETRVSIVGDGFLAENWKAPGVPLWLAGGPSGCDFFAEADHEVTVTAGGRLTGTFVVPSRGTCRQSSTGESPVLAGRYRIVYQCTACTIGEFTVTASARPGVDNCRDIGFTPNSDDVVANIVAYGLSCDEAEVVVRNVAKPLGPVKGAARGEANGFVCLRTSQSDGRGLPSAEYECKRASQRITFTRL